MTVEKIGLRIQIRGIVQGVGFRPFIFNLAERHKLVGWVKNTSNGVEIEVAGPEPAVTEFLNEIQMSPPPLSRIDELKLETCLPGEFSIFQIEESLPLPGEFIPVSPDVSICIDCQNEMFDPKDRRYRYPFINCTNCGPRFTIIKDIPYDRPNTTMGDFVLCPECLKEYEDPRNRRFHAQPVACPSCGPKIEMISKGMALGKGETALRIAREWIKDGKILAVKGLGGYHLACDATNPAVVAELRRRKKRSDKPFALMAYDIDTISKYCEVDPCEKKEVLSREKPIVLLARKDDCTLITSDIAPGLHELGIMLPYTPLHLLLMQPEVGYPELLVMTSGNMSEEPIAFSDGDATQRLGNIVDGFLTNDRPIHTRIDDSVIAAVSEKPFFYRRARGYAPNPILLPMNAPPILATGPELKNTFCLTREQYAFLSHHIGDMENLETYQAFESGIKHYERLFRIQLEAIACDLHPNYLATHYAENRANIEHLPIFYIQHHHAHLASCLTDNGWASQDPVIGLCFDGTGYGSDATVWGGEILFGGYSGYVRKFHLEYVALPGGDQAIRKPARMALSYLWKHKMDWEPGLPPMKALCEEERTVLRAQLERNINTPATTSMGRLFDAFSSLIGVCQFATYEGQAAIELEALADDFEAGEYPVDLDKDSISTAPLWESALYDWHNGTSPAIMSARFHNTIASMGEMVCRSLKQETGCTTVALSGGVWQNRLLLEKTRYKLEKASFRVLTHQQVPSNDGGVALGQAIIAACQLTK